MDPKDLARALPCYVCGDLPEELQAAVRQVLEADPDLKALVDEIDATSDTCRQAVAEVAPRLLRWERPAAAAVTTPVGTGWAALVAAGVLGALVVLLWGPGLTTTPARAAAHAGGLEPAALIDDNRPAGLEGWLETGDPQRLEAHLVARGVPAAIAANTAPRTPALHLVGGAPLPVDGGGAVVVFEDPEHQRFSCHMMADRALSLGPAETASRPGRPALHTWDRGAVRAVGWRGEGLLCVLVSTADAPTIAALARAQVWEGGP
ncbi:MAG: hypothetical protein H6739_15510 [Alphaproteobacteria bacterium]|nr:hypothetical protein [Alphaproteobacteria bacterium]